MTPTKTQLEGIFSELNNRIEDINSERINSGIPALARAEVQILGQMSLLANEKISIFLSLAQTADLDALLKMDSVIKKELVKILKAYGLIYDEDSPLVWKPKGTKFELLFDFKNVVVTNIDAESALVSKAVKAPEKNKQLIREAIVSGKFPNLISRIEANGGKLESFT